MSKGVVRRRYQKMTFFQKCLHVGNSFAAMTGRSAGWLAACRAITVTWQACRYLIDLSGKQLVLCHSLRNYPPIALCDWSTVAQTALR